jgi:hypothetical protein
MRDIAFKIEETITLYASAMLKLSDQEFSAKKIPDQWSKKEILGHLVDSAQNNIQRFVRGQYEDAPKIVYDQDEWVRLEDYQAYVKEDLVQLWVTVNKHLCRILICMDPSSFERKCDTGKGAVELHTLSFLAEDYLSHMHHHLNQIEKD